MSDKVVLGPNRVFPGGLSVSRTFGDLHSKIEELGGKPGVVSSVPEIISFKILPNYDYIVIGSDGLYDKISNEDVMKIIVEETNKKTLNITVNDVCKNCVSTLIKSSLDKRTTDNVTVVMITFQHFATLLPHSLCEFGEVNHSIDNEKSTSIKPRGCSISTFKKT